MAQKKKETKKNISKTKEQKVVKIHPMVGWIELNTKEPSKAKEFYSSLFGWKSVEEEMPGMGKYTMFGKTLKDFVGGMAPLQESGTPSHWLIYFTVKDVNTSSANAEKLGAKIIAPPMDIPDGRIAILVDPSGAMFAIWAPVKKKKK